MRRVHGILDVRQDHARVLLPTGAPWAAAGDPGGDVRRGPRGQRLRPPGGTERHEVLRLLGDLETLRYACVVIYI